MLFLPVISRTKPFNAVDIQWSCSSVTQLTTFSWEGLTTSFQTEKEHGHTCAAMWIFKTGPATGWAQYCTPGSAYPPESPSVSWMGIHSCRGLLKHPLWLRSKGQTPTINTIVLEPSSRGVTQSSSSSPFSGQLLCQKKLLRWQINSCACYRNGKEVNF